MDRSEQHSATMQVPKLDEDRYEPALCAWICCVSTSSNVGDIARRPWCHQVASPGGTGVEPLTSAV